MTMVLEINVCSLDLQGIKKKRFTKRLKKTFAAINQVYFKWGYNPFQKQPPEVFYKKAVLKFCNILRKTPVLESLFNKITGLQVCNFIKKRLTGVFLWILRNFQTYFEEHLEDVRLLIKPGIQERGTECGECGERGECSLGSRGMLLCYYSRECWRRFLGMFEKIPGNVQKDSGECWKRFRGMFKRIPGNVQKDSGECSKGFRGMFEKIPGKLKVTLILILKNF